MVAVIGLVLMPGSATAAASDTFSGVCDLTVQTRDSPSDPLEEHHVSIIGDGTCSGSLNGEPVQGAPTAVRASGSGFGVGLPVRDFGEGTLTFVGNAATIGFAFEAVGLSAVLTGNDGGGAVAAIDPFTQQPPPEPGQRTFRLRFLATAVGLSG